MSGETGRDGWTLDTLYTHLSRQLADLRALLDERHYSGQIALTAALTSQEKAVAAALAASKEAVTKAEVATEKRIEGLNELRQVVADISALQMPRNEAENRIAALAEKVDTNADRISRIETLKVGGNDRLTAIYAALGAVVAILTILVMAANGVFSGP